MTAPTLTDSQLDTILAYQLAIAWAGEALCKPPRLGWWRTDLTDPDGGGDLLARLLPKTHPWAALEAAIRCDRQQRQHHSDPDRLRTLFFWGYATDELLAARLASHKQAGASRDRLPFPCALETNFAPNELEAALRIPGTAAAFEIVPDGRQLTGSPPTAPELRARNLAAALLPLVAHYPLPFYRWEGARAD